MCVCCGCVCVCVCVQGGNVKVEGDAAVYGAAKLLPPEILADVMKGYIEVKMKVKPLSDSE